MQIIVTDRESIERGLLVRSSYALISIRDPARGKARVPRCTALRGVLHLAFDDAEPTDGFQLPPEIKLMNRRHAQAIWRFVDKHRDTVGTFVVHCHQGMSRSPAVAAAVARYLGVDEKDFWEQYTPNPFVYRLLQETMPRRSAPVPDCQ